MQFDEHRTALLAEAQDVTTPAARLDELAHLADDIYQGNGQDMHALYGVRLISAVAVNPNISIETMGYLAEHAPTFLLDNPALPLYVVTGDVLTWKYDQFRWLSSCAFGTGHTLYPLLTTVCAPAWRVRRRANGYHCWNASCFTCYPEKQAYYRERWQANTTPATPRPISDDNFPF